MKIVCRNPDCPDSLGRSPNPPQLEKVAEYDVAWTFKCRRCEKEGRVALRCVTKDICGGTFGSGRRGDATGQSAGEGISRFVSGAEFR